MAQPFGVPGSFSQALSSQFHGIFRIRWSESTQQFHIEQRCGRGRAPHKKVGLLDDQAIRWQDGYEFVLGVTPGDRTPCPRCGRTVKVPVLKMHYARCQACQKDFRACFYPLGDILLEHLRYIDPFRGGVSRVARDVEEQTSLREYRQNRSTRADRRDAVWDDWRNLLDIQSVGYTGKEFKRA